MGAMMFRYTSINRSSSKAVGVCKRVLKIDKNDLSPAVKKNIGDKVPLMGDKVFKYTFKFSLRFTECCYGIICLYYLDSVFYRIKDILWEL